MSNNENKNVWFVTGASKGLGLILVKKLLQEGKRVAATSRNLNELVKSVSEKTDNFLPLQMDLLNEKNVKEAVQKTVEKFGQLDVVVNNAGYGQLGTLEELSDEEVRTNFDVNVFGVLNVIRSVMPHLRAQGSGYIFNIYSIAGYTANFPGWGIYCSTKFALAGLTEALAAEAKPFGINVSVVYPGYFRTNFLSKDSLALPKASINEYENARNSLELHQNEINGNQNGDPEKAVTALIKIASEENPPLHLFLGSDSFNMAQMKINDVEKDLKTWKDVSLSTDFDKIEVTV